MFRTKGRMTVDNIIWVKYQWLCCSALLLIIQQVNISLGSSFVSN